MSGEITRTPDLVLTDTENITNAKLNRVGGGTYRVDVGAITTRELATGVLNFTGLVYWEESSTTFQPKVTGYKFGTPSNSVGSITTSSYIEQTEQSAPGTPASGYGRTYPKSDGKIYFKNDAGTEYDLTGTAFTYWEESGSILQPKVAGYNLGAVGNEVGDITSTGFLELAEQAAPGTPATGFGRIYPKTDGWLYFLDDAGTEYEVTKNSMFTELHSSSHTLSAIECYGAVYYVNAAATLTLPAVATGMHLTVATVGAVAVNVKAGPSDLIYLDGIALDDGDKITNSSSAGNISVLTYYSADGWYAATDGWADGGA